MKIFKSDIPTYAVVLVVVFAILIGVTLSLLLLYLYRKKQTVTYRKLSRDNNRGVKKSCLKNHGGHRDGTVKAPEITLQKVNIRRTTPPGMVEEVQPPKKVDLLPSVTSSIVSDVSRREDVLEARFRDGKVARMRVSVCYHDNALWFAVLELYRLHGSISLNNAKVDLRKEVGSVKDKLRSVRVERKGRGLKGCPTTRYSFPIKIKEIPDANFKFYLWSVGVHSRYYQAGVCDIKFKDTHIQSFQVNSACEVKEDFVEPTEEDFTGCASISLALRYSTRTEKLEVTLGSISKIPKLGWRSNWSSLSSHFEPYPVVKVTMSHDEGEFKTQTHTTGTLRGYDVQINKVVRFEMPLQEIQLPGSMKLTIDVSHSNLQLLHSTIGMLEFSGQSTGKEGEHWREMIQMISTESKPQMKTHYLKNRSKI